MKGKLIKKREKLKEELKLLDAETRFLSLKKHEANNLLKDPKERQESNVSYKKQIELLRERKVEIKNELSVIKYKLFGKVTDHAVLRYLERFQGLDTYKIRQDIINRDDVIKVTTPEGFILTVKK